MCEQDRFEKGRAFGREEALAWADALLHVLRLYQVGRDSETVKGYLSVREKWAADEQQ